MHVERFRSIAPFLAEAGPFLERREVENNLALGIAGSLRDHPTVYPDPPLLAVVRSEDAVLLSAVRTPPYGLVISGGPDAAVDSLADELAAGVLGPDGENLPSVNGPAAASGRFAQRWHERTGASIELDGESEILRLDRVARHQSTWRSLAPGSIRAATLDDAGTLSDWLVAFGAEARQAVRLDRLPQTIDRWARQVDRTMYLWLVDGTPVCMAGTVGATPHGIRIGPVYTSPDSRNHGYAGALVAAVCDLEIASGRLACCLYVDLDNAAARHVYRRLGFEPVIETRVYRFDPATSA